MKILNEDTHLNTFFEKLRRASNRALLLDYDGTLSPFRVERNEATLYPGVRELLSALIDAKQLRVIIISGRAIDDLVPLLGLKQLPEIWGSHGWERLLPDGRYVKPDLSEPVRRTLAQVPDWIEAERLQPRYEPKPAGFALHWRGTDENIVREIREKALRKWSSLLEDSGLIAKEFDGGIELRAAGKDKGDAVRTIISEMGEGATMAYLGDDLTDEDAFIELKGKGLAVLVRPEFRPTAADLWLQPPDDLIEFLNNWVTICRGN